MRLDGRAELRCGGTPNLPETRLDAERYDVGCNTIGSRAKRLGAAAAVAVTALGLASCSPERAEQWTRLGLPEAASDRAVPMGHLWVNTWIAAFAIGALVWGLILFAVFRYRKRGDRAPRQTRYNLPLEILYTAVPFLIVGVLFYWTIRVQNDVMAESEQPDYQVDVVAMKWSWAFNYDSEDIAGVDTVVHDIGTAERIPTLYLPVDRSVRFNVTSPDVIHSFWVPAFYFKRDVIPGQDSSFELTATKEGVFAGKCAELCGTYHSAMLFEVHVVSEEEFEAHLKELKADGQTGTYDGHDAHNTVTGLEGRQEGEGE